MVQSSRRTTISVRRREAEEAERAKRIAEEEEKKRKFAEEVERKKRAEEEYNRKLLEKSQKEREEQARIAATREDMIDQFANSAIDINEIEKILSIHLKDNSNKSLEKKAYSLCKKKCDYAKYLAIFPSGIYAAEANNRLKAIEFKKKMILLFGILMSIGILSLIIYNVID